jgi:hypothetical protein
MAPKRDEEWVSRGILSACECFGCSNKVAHRLRETKVSILCRDPCRYKPIKTERERPIPPKIDDIEQIVNR